MPDPLIAYVTRCLDYQSDLFHSVEFQKMAEKAAQYFKESLNLEDDPSDRAEVFKNIIQSPHSLNILSGPPGSAKTYLAATVMKFFGECEQEVWGMSVSEQAVERLSEKSGMQGITLDAFFKNPEVIPSHSVVVIDEAGLIGTQTMIDLLEKSHEGQWTKLLLLGDYRQEVPSDASQPLRVFEQEFPELWFGLKTGFRQKTPVQRDFVTNLYQSDANKALTALEESQNILWMDGRDNTLDEAVMAYLKWRSHGDNYDKTALILTQSEEEAVEANQLVQSRIRTFSSKMIWTLFNDVHAMTIRDAQGLAMDQSFVVITEKVVGQTMVSACSRHRFGIQLIVDKSVYKDADNLSKDANQFTL